LKFYFATFNAKAPIIDENLSQALNYYTTNGNREIVEKQIQRFSHSTKTLPIILLALFSAKMQKLKNFQSSNHI
jgi:hypothetical protein